MLQSDLFVRLLVGEILLALFTTLDGPHEICVLLI